VDVGPLVSDITNIFDAIHDVISLFELVPTIIKTMREIKESVGCSSIRKWSSAGAARGARDV
jgi:hypothetical protein